MAQKFLSGILATAQVNITRTGNAQSTTLVLQDNARIMKLGRDAIDVYDVSDGTTAAHLYLQNANGGHTTFGGNITTNGLSATAGSFTEGVTIADVIDGPFTALRLMNQKTYGSGTGTNEKVRFVMGISESGISFTGREGFAIELGIGAEGDSSDGVVDFKVRDGGTLGTYQTVNGHNKSVEFVGSIHTAGNLGIGTAPTSRQLSVFRTTAGSIANFLHYTDATTFQGLYIQVSQATNDVIFQSSGSSGGGFKFYSGNAEKAGIDASGNATFSGSVTCGNLHASSFTDVITNSILTASADLDIKTVLTGRDIRFRSGSNAVQLRVKGDATGILINDHANLRGVATTSATATTIVATVAHALFSGIFFDFVIKNGTNVRAGTLTVCHDGTTVEYAETSTVDLGDTSDVTLSSNISGTLIRLIATSTSSTWTIKSLIRAI